MRIGKIFIAGLLSAALTSPAFAAGGQAVRPTVKAVSLASAQQRLQPVQGNVRAGAKLKSANADGSDSLLVGGLVVGGVGLGILALSGKKKTPVSP